MDRRKIITTGSSQFNQEDLNAKKLEQRRKQNKRHTSLVRKASCYPGGSGSSAGADVIGMAPEYFVPQLENSALELPKNRQEIISWCDFYYSTNELVGAAVDIHSTLSIADFAISCPDRAIQEAYEQILEDLDFHTLLLEISHEYFRVGNVFPFGKYNENERTWDEFILIPAMNIELTKSLLTKDPHIYLIPDESLRNASQSQNPDIKNEFLSLPEEFRDSLGHNRPMLLDKSRVSHISSKAIAGTMWGVPPLFRCFKTLVYNDKLYRAQEAIADRQITPLRIISLVTSDGLPVTSEEEEEFRKQLIEADFDPNYIILTSGTVKDNYIGSSGRILPLNSEMDMVERKIASGMQVSKALLHGEGPTYSNAQVYQTSMNYYYSKFRKRLTSWLKHKVFKPIAEARGYYSKVDTEQRTNLTVSDIQKKLIIPDILWRGSNILDSQTVQIYQRLWEGKKISTDTFMKMVIPDIDPSEERTKVLREAEEDVVKQSLMPKITENMNTPIPDASTQKVDPEESKLNTLPPKQDGKVLKTD